MSRNTRTLRSAANLSKLPSSILSWPVYFTDASSSFSDEAIQIVAPGSRLPGLESSELSLLHKKQSRLELNASAALDNLLRKTQLRNALEASLIFAQYEAGTAVCIDRAGWILTCAHCFGETEEDWKAKNRRWLLFYTGLAVQVECRAWDSKRDLALAKIITIESSAYKDRAVPGFHFVPLSSRAPSRETPIVCIGQPGSDDLESTFNRRTNYNLIEMSEGRFRGMVTGADPQDNSEIGTLKHDAWTYWGHSGAPLLREADGTLIGLHSSWDDQTTMRHGVPLIAIKNFLQQQTTASICPSRLMSAAVLVPSPSNGCISRHDSLEGQAPSN